MGLLSSRSAKLVIDTRDLGVRLLDGQSKGFRFAELGQVVILNTGVLDVVDEIARKHHAEKLLGHDRSLGVGYLKNWSCIQSATRLMAAA
ncbi:hypothetical protein D3C85_1653490 [compost metagenome]